MNPHALFAVVAGLGVVTAVLVVRLARRLAREKRANTIIRQDVTYAQGQVNATAESARLAHAHLAHESQLAAAAVEHARDMTARADEAHRMVQDAISQTGQAMAQTGRALYVSSQIDTLVDLMTAQAAQPPAGRHARRQRLRAVPAPDTRDWPAA